MDFRDFADPAVMMIGLAALPLLFARGWRWRLGALAVQYVGVFILVALSWPAGLASIKLVAGWMVAAILGISRIEQLPSERRRWPTEQVFLGVVVFLVVLSISTFAPEMGYWLPGVRVGQAWGSLLLIGTGLLQLGFAARGLRVVLGLLTLLSGFEIMYAVVETSALVAGLMAVVNLGIAMVGAYLLGNQPEDEE